MSSLAWLALVVLSGVIGWELGRVDRAHAGTMHQLDAIANAYDRADDEWLDALAREREAARCHPEDGR